MPHRMCVLNRCYRSASGRKVNYKGVLATTENPQSLYSYVTVDLNRTAIHLTFLMELIPISRFAKHFRRQLLELQNVQYVIWGWKDLRWLTSGWLKCGVMRICFMGHPTSHPTGKADWCQCSWRQTWSSYAAGIPFVSVIT